MFRTMMVVPALAAVLVLPAGAYQGRGRGQGHGQCGGACAKCAQCEGCQQQGRNWQGNRRPMNRGGRGPAQPGQEQAKPAPAPEKK